MDCEKRTFCLMIVYEFLYGILFNKEISNLVINITNEVSTEQHIDGLIGCLSGVGFTAHEQKKVGRSAYTCSTIYAFRVHLSQSSNDIYQVSFIHQTNYCTDLNAYNVVYHITYVISYITPKNISLINITDTKK